MNKKQQTVDTYNKSAQDFVNKFKNQGVRINDIEEVFDLLKKENPSVLEIGCGYGREASEIVKRTDNYLGIDISESFIKLAKEKVPNGNFAVADIEEYEFSKSLDIVFAFASLLHVDKENLRKILNRLKEVLNPEGIIRISLKYSSEYHEYTKEDEFGVRTFYLYSPEDIEILASDFQIIRLKKIELRGIQWLEILLKSK